VLTSTEIREALSEPVAAIVSAVRMTLEATPPELSSDIMDKGIVMAGGGSLLHGLDKHLAEETEISVYVVEDPLLSVAYGTGKVLEEIDTLREVLYSSRH
jgi:rod shape-determining protein MreB